MADIKNFTRTLDGEHVVAESPGFMSRDQVILIADATGYKAGTVMAKLTAGGNVGKWCKFDSAGANGAAVAKGILFAQKRASTGTQRAVVHSRDCRINGKKIVFDQAVPATNNEKAAAYASLAGKNADGTGNVQVGF